MNLFKILSLYFILAIKLLIANILIMPGTLIWSPRL